MHSSKINKQQSKKWRTLNLGPSLKPGIVLFIWPENSKICDTKTCVAICDYWIVHNRSFDRELFDEWMSVGNGNIWGIASGSQVVKISYGSWVILPFVKAQAAQNLPQYEWQIFLDCHQNAARRVHPHLDLSGWVRIFQGLWAKFFQLTILDWNQRQSMFPDTKVEWWSEWGWGRGQP